MATAGCSSGFGAAAARRFAEIGWNVVATMRDTTGAADLAALANILVTRLDVDGRASIDSAVVTGIDRFGRIAAVVNNVGYGRFAVFEGVPREAIRRRFDLTRPA